jgi:hypothetical protein
LPHYEFEVELVAAVRVSASGEKVALKVVPTVVTPPL